MNKQIKVVLYLTLGFGVLSLAGYFITSLTKSIDVEGFTESLGLWGPIFIISGIAFGGIVVPMTALPFVFASLALYGVFPTFILYYLGNTIIAPVVDYWIANKYGRPIVTKLTGMKTMATIDKLAEKVGTKSLILLRLFGGILFDSVSYAVGLTKYDFKKYFILTALLPIPGMLLTTYILEKGVNTNPLYFLFIIFWGYGAGAITLYLIFKEKQNIE